jgi:tricorn protease
VDWKGVRDSYAKLIDASVTRWDVNYVLGEFIGELNASHTYNGGGDLESAPSRGVGMLGVDWEVHQGAYRIKHIVEGGPWDADVRSPLSQPGVNVKAGQYVLAVNGAPLDVGRDPWAAFQGMADQAVVLTVNDKPTLDGSRQVVVKCLGDEVELRFRDWIEQRRQRVDKATGGKAGYVYVQSTGVGAQNERADSRSLHRTAEPAAARAMGRADRRRLGVATGRAPRREGDAHQRLERVGR